MGSCGTSGFRFRPKPCLTRQASWQLWMPRLGRHSFVSFALAIDDPDERPQHLGHALPRDAGDNHRGLLRGALQPRDLLLELLWRERVRFAQRDDLGLVG